MLNVSGTPEWQKKNKTKTQTPNILSVQALRIFLFHGTQTPSFQPVQALRYFIFMKLRPGPMFSACARTSQLNFHESPGTCFQPLRAISTFMSLLFPTTWDFISFHRFIYRDSSPSLHCAFPQTCPEPTSFVMKSCELKFLLTSC